MLGILRLILAFMVVANHFWLPVANKIGANAVASFYIISGFLMTHSIVREYGTSYKGVFFFLSNRALRIFPAYWIVLFISVGLLWLFPTTFGDTYSTMKMPEGSWQWWQNLLLVDLSTSPSVVSPPAWTLSVELFFYIAMPLALSRSKSMSLVWLLVSIAYTIYLLGVGATFSERYTPAAAASVFFAVGACLFHYKPTFELPVSVASVTAALFVIFPLLVERAGGDRLMFGFYGGAALFIPIFLTFISFRDDRLKNTDKLAGDLAYPVFLSHIMAGGMVRIVFPSLSRQEVPFLALTLLVCVLISLMWVGAERKYLSPIRDWVREAARRHRSRPLELSHGQLRLAASRQS